MAGREIPRKSVENAKSREWWLSASGANPWVAVFEEKSFSSPNETLLEIVSRESRALLFSKLLVTIGFTAI